MAGTPPTPAIKIEYPAPAIKLEYPTPAIKIQYPTPTIKIEMKSSRHKWIVSYNIRLLKMLANAIGLNSGDQTPSSARLWQARPRTLHLPLKWGIDPESCLTTNTWAYEDHCSSFFIVDGFISISGRRSSARGGRGQGGGSQREHPADPITCFENRIRPAIRIEYNHPQTKKNLQ